MRETHVWNKYESAEAVVCVHTVCVCVCVRVLVFTLPLNRAWTSLCTHHCEREKHSALIFSNVPLLWGFSCLWCYCCCFVASNTSTHTHIHTFALLTNQNQRLAVGFYASIRCDDTQSIVNTWNLTLYVNIRSIGQCVYDVCLRVHVRTFAYFPRTPCGELWTCILRGQWISFENTLRRQKKTKCNQIELFKFRAPFLIANRWKKFELLFLTF